MTRKVFSLLTSLIMIVSLVGVMPAVIASASSPMITYKTFKKTYYSDIGKQICHIELKRPVIKGNKKSYKKINKYLKKIHSDYTEYFLNLASEIDPNAYYSYTLSSSIEVTYNKGSKISFKETYQDYTGGAHGYNMINGYTFNLKTGKGINIYKSSKYKAKVKRKIVKKFKKDFDKDQQLNTNWYFDDALQIVKNPSLKDYNYSLQHLQFKGYDYYLKGKYLYVVFNPYEIASYMAGVQEIQIKIK